jgi:uncharacterized protein (DUF1684 family)
VEPITFTSRDALDLLDWKRRVFALYAMVCESDDPTAAWQIWCDTRQALFRQHPQSPIPAASRATYSGPDCYPYDPRWRVTATVTPTTPEERALPASTSGTLPFLRVGLARFDLEGQQHELELTWNTGYGGGLLVVFADHTSGGQTYGGGRYLVDTVKGADLGFDRDRETITLDFNFAYNPSCSYDPRYTCPLAPAANRLPVAITAGERIG